MKLLDHLDTLLARRTKRERILLLTTSVFAIFYLIYPSLSDLFTQISTLQNEINKSNLYLQKNKDLNIAQNLEVQKRLNLQLQELSSLLNLPSLQYSQALKQINQYALKHQVRIWNLNSNNERANYEISLSGSAKPARIFDFLHFIENLPLIHLQEFKITQNGDFSLTLKNHKILPLDPSLLSQSSSNLTPQTLSAQLKDALTKDKITLPSIQKQSTPLKLEAIFNQKAKINGIWLQEGDELGEFKLTKIEENSVSLQSKDTKLKLGFKSKEVFNEVF